MSSATEVELRALIEDPSALERLLAARSARGSEIKHQNRFLIDFSTFLEGVENRTRDIRVRITNGNREIIAKVGAFGATARLESAVNVSSSMQDLLTTMAYMGFRKGVAAIRVIDRFNIDGIEYAVQEVRSYDNPEDVFSRFVEAEIVTDQANKDDAVAKVRDALAEFGLDELSESQWYDYINHLNEHANGVFDFDADPDWEVINTLGVD